MSRCLEFRIDSQTHRASAKTVALTSGDWPGRKKYEWYRAEILPNPRICSADRICRFQLRPSLLLPANPVRRLQVGMPIEGTSSPFLGPPSQPGLLQFHRRFHESALPPLALLLSG